MHAHEGPTGANDSEIIEEICYYYDRILKHFRDHGMPVGFFVYSPNLRRINFGRIHVGSAQCFLMLGGGGALALKTKINWIELI